MSQYSVEAVLKVTGLKQFEGAFKSAEKATKNFDDSTKALGNVGKGFKKVGGTLTKFITAPAIVAATAIGGIAIAGGFKRLVGIDTAKAKLTALGHSAESVEDIMVSALDSVKGTAFGLAEAATVAASAVAAGVEPGKELTKYLTLTGDAAAIAGVSMEDMGGIFNKVQTASKASNQELKQLSEKGIPIYQYLAKQLGVTEDKVYDLAKAGEISSADFRAAIEENIGGAAAIMGEKSFTAAWENTKAALARVGAAFLDAGGEGGGFFSQLKPLMSELTGILDGMAGSAEEWGVRFGDAFLKLIDKIKETVEWWKGLSDAQQGAIVKFGLFMVALGPLLSALGSLIGTIVAVSTAIAFLATPIGLLTVAITLAVVAVVAVVAAIIVQWDKMKAFTLELKDSLLLYFSQLKEQGVETMQNFKTQMVDPVIEMKDNFVAYVTELKDRVVADFQLLKTDAVNYANELKTQATTSFNNLKTSISSAVTNAKTSVTDAFDSMKKWASEKATGLKDDVVAAWGTIKERTATFFSDARDSVTSAFDNIDLFAAGKAVLNGFFDGLKNKWEDVKSWLSGLGDKIKALKGPMSYDKVMLLDEGKAIINGLNRGMNESFKHVEKNVSGMGKRIQNSLNSSPVMDINGSIARSNGQVKSMVSHEINNNGNSRMENLLSKLANGQTIVLDSGELVGATYPQYDNVGGKRTQLTERWGLA